MTPTLHRRPGGFGSQPVTGAAVWTRRQCTSRRPELRGCVSGSCVLGVSVSELPTTLGGDQALQTPLGFLSHRAPPENRLSAQSRTSRPGRAGTHSQRLLPPGVFSDAQLLEMTPLLGRNSRIHNFPSTASVVSPLQGVGRSCHLCTHPPGQCHGEQSVTKGHGFRGFNN